MGITWQELLLMFFAEPLECREKIKHFFAKFQYFVLEEKLDIHNNLIVS